MKQGLQRRLATGTNAVLVGLFVTVMVGAVVDLAARYRVRVDLTADAQATLTADTRETLAEVTAAGAVIEVIGTSHQRRNKQAGYRDRKVKDLLREMELGSSHIQTTFVDLDRDRQLAEALEISNYGTLVVRRGDVRVDFKEREVFKRIGGSNEDGTPKVDFRGEALAARGLQQVLAGDARTVVILQGHGEADPKDGGSQGLTRLVEIIERQGWDVEIVDLLRDRDSAGAPAIPEGADAVLIVGPKTAYDPSEDAAIRQFSREGGGVGVWVEPGRPALGYLAEVGVVVPAGTAYDRPSLVPFDDWWLPRPGRHPIVDDLAAEDIKVVFAHGAALRSGRVDDVKTTPLLSSSRGGWLEVVPETPPADFDAGVDEPGPVTVAVALERPGGWGRTLVFGDASMVGNDLMNRLGNPSLATNSLRWLVGEDDRMSVAGRTGKVRAVTLSPAALSRVGWLVIGIWPVLVVLLGGVVWWLRRER